MEIEKKIGHLKEGLSIKSPDYNNVISDVESVAISDKSALIINNLSDANSRVALNQFCIKGSYNSAYSGKYVSDEMVKYVLSRGCRFLDFELYYLPKLKTTDNYNLYVGYETDSLALNPRVNNNELPLFYDILKSTISNAFSQQVNNKYYTQNTNDPLFVQIRIKCDESVKKDAYTKLRGILDALFVKDSIGFSQYRYKNPVYFTNSLRSLLKKVVFVFEQNPENKTYLGDYVNMEMNGKQLYKQPYSSVNTNKYQAKRPNILTTSTTDVSTFTEIVPDKNVKSQSNVNVFSSIWNYGYQVNMMQYYVLDSNLQNSDKMFNSYKGSFVLMVNCLNYIENYADPIDLK